MTTMSSHEIMRSSARAVDKWFFDESNILESCLKEENKQRELYGDTNYMCPYYTVMLHLARLNIEKGWTKEEILQEIAGYLDDDISEDNNP